MKCPCSISAAVLLVGVSVLLVVCQAAPPAPNARVKFETRNNVLHFVSETNGQPDDATSALRRQRLVAGNQASKGSIKKLVTAVKGVLANLGQRSSSSSSGEENVGNSIKCNLCKAAVDLFQHLVDGNSSREKVETAFVEVCSIFKIQHKRVCQGLASLFAPEFFTVLCNVVVTPSEVCSIMIDECGDPNLPFDNWNITLPDIPQPPSVAPKPPKKGSPTKRVLHLTDIHVDFSYKTGSVADCGEPLCCREGDGGSEGSWKFGDYRNCDTPPWTLENLMAHLSAQNESFDYIIWTGDVPGHNVWNQSREDQLNVLSHAVDLFLKYFPGKPIYPSLGNHESSPVNSFPPNYIKGDNSISWLYDALAEHWSHWLPKDAISTVKSGAYYTVSPSPGFRIISLNMNYCNDENWWMLINTADPNGELQWLIDTLQAAENKNEKVHIIGHIPPGINDCLKRWSWNFYKIVSRYQNTITGQFYGHTHSDSFTVFYDEQTLKRPVNVAYVGPSVTPYSDQNMGYRIYTVDGHYPGSSFYTLDHETYYLNLTKANLEGKITWEFEYTAKDAYGLNNLFPADWDQLITNMKTNQTALDLYHRFFQKSRHTDSCDSSCRKSLLCEARRGRSHDSSFCKDL